MESSRSAGWLRVLVALGAAALYLALAYAVGWAIDRSVGTSAASRALGGPSSGILTFGILLCGAPLVAAIAPGLLLGPVSPPASACRGCGYDLTGNVSRVCPECGRRVQHTPPPVP